MPLIGELTGRRADTTRWHLATDAQATTQRFPDLRPVDPDGNEIFEPIALTRARIDRDGGADPVLRRGRLEGRRRFL